MRGTRMREKEVEKYLIRKVSSLGGIAFKFVSPGMSGVPDRIVCYQGQSFFVELKAPGSKPRELQMAMAKRIRTTGMKVYCISNKEQVNDLIKVLPTGILPQESRYDRI